ncbi:Translation initiation factor 2 (IF-2; GTPase)-like [Candidatus Sulfobium mesophilum]|uniref:Translation initiation factor 2 (IF-2 GTPase)-like n=1 Tax=Candidatus Sulfobium mesophilum TaxID=2016548 RepID=A0A2U3QKF3_9BACT|nr:Translation initiation factor 2 (IF-2; GTPase)-like [Candidatus Sulfobium mesophilum]
MRMSVGKDTDIRLSTGAAKPPPRLEIVLKCDSIGSMEGVTAALSKVPVTGVEILTIHSGVGAVTQSDVLIAETASRLIVGFQVGVVAGLEKILRERHVEIRLYDIIYKLSDDVNTIAQGMVSRAAEEEITGSGKVVALFKSTRKGIIIGCEVGMGHLAVGQHFRIISAMGPIYSGTIESLHIGEQSVQKATPGQKAGIKIKNFNRAKIGDLVESYRPQPFSKGRPWEPKGEVIRR